MSVTTCKARPRLSSSSSLYYSLQERMRIEMYVQGTKYLIDGGLALIGFIDATATIPEQLHLFVPLNNSVTIPFPIDQVEILHTADERTNVQLLLYDRDAVEMLDLLAIADEVLMLGSIASV